MTGKALIVRVGGDPDQRQSIIEAILKSGRNTQVLIVDEEVDVDFSTLMDDVTYQCQQEEAPVLETKICCGMTAYRKQARCMVCGKRIKWKGQQRHEEDSGDTPRKKEGRLPSS